MIEKPHEVEDICPSCNGQGWTAEHSNYGHTDGGECTECPVQVQCEVCEATGKILMTEVGKII